MNQLMLTATEGGYVGANTLIKESVRIVTKSNTVATQTYDTYVLYCSGKTVSEYNSIVDAITAAEKRVTVLENHKRRPRNK
jgi:hypothetical protein